MKAHAQPAQVLKARFRWHLPQSQPANVIEGSECLELLALPVLLEITKTVSRMSLVQIADRGNIKMYQDPLLAKIVQLIDINLTWARTVYRIVCLVRLDCLHLLDRHPQMIVKEFKIEIFHFDDLNAYINKCIPALKYFIACAT